VHSELGLLILGAVVGEDECGFLCVDGTYVTVRQLSGPAVPRCNCVCGPSDGQGVHGPDGPDEPCTK